MAGAALMLVLGLGQTALWFVRWARRDRARRKAR
jgi:hypothetical protein